MEYHMHVLVKNHSKTTCYRISDDSMNIIIIITRPIGISTIEYRTALNYMEFLQLTGYSERIPLHALRPM